MTKKTKNERESLATFRRIVEYDKLIANGKYPSVADFQKKFEISEAIVHRDLDALRYDFGADGFLEYDRLKKGYHYTNKKNQRSKTEELARSMLDSHSTKYFLIDCALDAGAISKERAKELKWQFSKEIQLASEIDGEKS